jgi:serine/threonine-protein kinase
VSDQPEQLDRLKTALADRYRIEHALGEGGMATVYLAEDLKHQRKVAIKVLKPDVAAAIGAARFLREIEIAAQLQHPHIVSVYDSGIAAGLLYYVMPHIDGESLADRIERDGPLPIRDVVRMLEQVVDALSVAHNHGVVHRDIKPHNILFSRKNAYLTDFGVAKAAAVATSGADKTGTGLALGTPRYMSPEQAAGDPNVDHRADIYSVGVVAYEALTARPPFPGENPRALLAAHLAETPPPLATPREDIPPHVAEVVMRCLAKDRDERWQSAPELLKALESKETPQPTTRAVRATAPVWRRSRWLVAGVSVLLVGTVWLTWPGATAPVDVEVVAAVPFRVTGAAPEIHYLREGIVDLFHASMNGEGGPRALFPQTVIGAWERAGGSATAELPEAASLEIARELGAGQVLLGSIVGSSDHMVVNARLLGVGAGAVRAQAMEQGPIDSLSTMVDRLTGRLLGLLAGEDLQRVATLTSTSLDALKAYLEGQAAYRAGRYPVALRHFARAIESDSSFALAGLRHAITARWVTGRSSDFGSRVAWEHRDRLSERDRLLLNAWLGPRGLEAASGVEVLAAREVAVSALSDQPEAWYLYGDHLYHRGPVLGVEDSMERAMAAFRRALELDPAFGPVVDHLLERAVNAGDTATVRALAGRYLGEGSATPRDAMRYWLVAATLQDSVALAGWRDRVEEMTLSELLQTAGIAQQTGIDLDAALRTSEAALRRVSTQSGRRGALFVRMNLMHNLGRPSAAAALKDQTAEGEPVTGVHQWMHMTDWVFWEGDSAAAAHAAGEVSFHANRPAPQSPPGRNWHRDNCAAGVWRAGSGDVQGARRALRNLRTATTETPEPLRDPSLRVCAAMLEVWVAPPAARAAVIEQADSLSRSGPPVSLPRLYQLNLVLARAFEAQGDVSRALAAVRRRATGETIIYLSSFLREEGRLAALTGDREGAIRAYQHYLTLRADPEPALQQELRQVRAELQQLAAEPQRP